MRSYTPPRIALDPGLGDNSDTVEEWPEHKVTLSFRESRGPGLSDEPHLTGTLP
jgi:hypothetical protein